MSLIGKITYNNKTNVIAVTDRDTEATAEDFNDLKSVVNNCVDAANWIKSDEVAIPSGSSVISFNDAYPVGVVIKLVVHNCVNGSGYAVAHTISGLGVNGFTITVGSACTLTYLAVPKR